MKILFLTPFNCVPPLKTNTVRPFNWLRHLTGRHEVTYLAFSDKGGDFSLPAGVSGNSRVILRDPRSGPARRLANLFTGRPYFIMEQFRSDEMESAVREACLATDFDVVHCGSLAMAQYCPPAAGRVLVLDGVDCNARNNLQVAGSSASLRERVLAWVDWRKLRSYEPESYSRFDIGILASDTDSGFLLGLDGGLKLRALPNGVDLDYFRPTDPGPPGARPEVVFAGPLGYPPNLDAVKFFVSEVMPRLLAARPDLIFRVLGKTDGLEARVPRSPNVAFEGYVPDVRPYLAAAGAVVCPLRIGTGIKNKALEAMAAGKPLIMTSLASEGVRAVAGRDYLLADSASDTADSVLRLLRDGALAAGIGTAARAAMERGHSWSSLGSELEASYLELLRGRGARP